MGKRGAPSSSASAEIRALLRQLQYDTVLAVSPALFGLGFILLMLAGSLADPLQGGLPALLLFLLPLLVWGLLQVNYLAAAWTLIAGALVANLLVVTWAGMDAALPLLTLVVGLATLVVGLRGGIVTALCCALLLLYAPANRFPIDPALRNVTLLGIAGAVGLVWLTSRPLLTAVAWFWASHQQSRKALDQARDYQGQLGQMVDDLADANVQLTRLNRAAAALRQMAEEARKAKQEFVANVSHELRTPLNMIIGFSEMITQSPTLYGDKLPSTLLADLDVILRNSQHLSRLIDDVLDLSQIEAEQMALSKERIALQEIIEAAIIAVRPLFVSKGLALEVELPSDLPLIYCDRTRIRQVVLNLLSNAGRFTEQGGVQLRAWASGASITVSIQDTGAGIPAEAMERLFQPFQQLDTSLRRRAGGSGLGLSISKRFVELHDGQMWVQSEAGAGATFFFRLPVDPPLPLASGGVRWLNPVWEYRQRVHPSLAPTPTLRPRFVVLENEDVLRRLLTRYLDHVEVDATTTWPDALKALARSPAQGLLVNEIAWSKNIQLLNQLHELPYGAPLLLCSIPGLHQASDGLGVADYLVKPVARDTLLAALSRLSLKHRTVLVVDDEVEALQLYRRMLASADERYRVLRASNGQEALQILADQRPDAILLDLVMPEMDGFRLLAAKSQDPALCDIPAIVITARDPAGQPIVSSALTVAQRGGLSMAQLLACIEALSGILAPSGQTGVPTPPKTFVD
jgi:signal transduction histidine kinase/CheY-like chemotaxis protein